MYFVRPPSVRAYACQVFKKTFFLALKFFSFCENRILREILGGLTVGNVFFRIFCFVIFLGRDFFEELWFLGSNSSGKIGRSKGGGSRKNPKKSEKKIFFRKKCFFPKSPQMHRKT